MSAVASGAPEPAAGHGVGQAVGREAGAADEGRPRVVLVVTHPDPDSLTCAVAAAIHGSANAAGATTVVHDLYGDGFDPRLAAVELPGRGGVGEGASAAGTGHPAGPRVSGPPRFGDALAARYAGDLVRADVVIVVHPVWFFHVPAALKGWVDRVVREDVAFALDARGGVTGLLRARSALIVTTANTSPSTERSVFGDAIESFWRAVVFGPAGVATVERLALWPVRGSDASTRSAWLAEAAEAAARHVRDAA